MREDMEPPALDSGSVTDVHVEPEVDPQPETPSLWAGLGTRTISSIVLAVVFLGALWQGGWVFIWLTLLAALMMAKEWNSLTESEPVIWRIAGLFYVTIPCASLIWLRNAHFEEVPDAGRWLVLFVVLTVSATDIGAYFTGRKIGGPKLAPVISPNKTWAGLGGGVASAAVVGGLAHGLSPFPSTLIFCILMGAAMAVLGQVGDLFESYVKRRVGAKDSGSLIPGHGGLLDRVDGYVLTVPFFAWCAYMSGYAL